MDRLSSTNARLQDRGVKKDQDHGSRSRKGSGLRLGFKCDGVGCALPVEASPKIKEDEELVTNALETVVNLAPFLNLQIFSLSKPSFIKIMEKHAVQAIMGILKSSVKAWNFGVAELIGRLIINPDNEPFILPFSPQRLVDILSLPAVDAQAAVVGALYNLAEVNMDCHLRLTSERCKLLTYCSSLSATDRLLKVMKIHSMPEVCLKAAIILESLITKPHN
ncbi:hypothetical protein HYC85_012468 [Camellia sinensis]|uniref:Armadillo repeat-containing domain-containing protein n=1 Tax=Camellia sinensis TaxID=4442 RepID=A0A7J7HCX9_CAMSI|nr:hypothetical protein HYC85_012468 [Camellia sinensis]